MREMIGHLVARRGAEEAGVRTNAPAPRRCKQFLYAQLLRKEDRADDALIDDKSIDASIVIGKAPSIVHFLTDGARADSARTGSPITIVYAREIYTDDAIEEIAGAIPGFGVFD